MFDFKGQKKIVIKIGSSLLVESGRIRQNWFLSLVDDVVKLTQKNVEIIIVSSGAIALGRSFLKTYDKFSIEQKQAAAAVGQINLMSFYQEKFAAKNLVIAQILLGSNDFKNDNSYNNCQNTIRALLQNSIIPIINENDSVATAEIKIGDNDTLAAEVAKMVGADSLILLSDVNGLYDKDPNLNPDARLIREVIEINQSIEGLAADSPSKVGTGGMITKISAAKIATRANCHTIIVNGQNNSPISQLESLDGEFTIFYSN